MLWIFGFPLAVLVIVIHDHVAGGYGGLGNDWTMLAMGVVLCLMVMFMALMAGCGLAAAIGSAFASYPVEISRQELVALRDKDGIEGRFFLGSGTMEGAPYYFYYSKISAGGFKPGKVKVSDGVRVYEDAPDGTATLTSYEWDSNLGLAWLIAIPVNSGGYSYDFHVPKGTIRTGFTM